jgi:hypothetical protein
MKTPVWAAVSGRPIPGVRKRFFLREFSSVRLIFLIFTGIIDDYNSDAFWLLNEFNLRKRRVLK